MTHAHWSSGKSHLARSFNLMKLKLIMPCNDDENYSPSEFYYPEQTNDPNKFTAETLAVKALFGLFYKVTANCNLTKP